MPPLHVRIDAEQAEPVWIEPGGKGRSMVFFDPEFRLELAGEPRVTAPNGVVLVDGAIVDPDRGAPGLSVCPGGDIVSFSMAGPAGG
jgi:hypothetical protein